MIRALGADLHAALFFRSFFIQSFWSFEGMQNLGVLFIMDPWLRRVYSNKENYQEAASRYTECFGTNPYMIGFVTGVLGGMEERLSSAPEEDKAVLRQRIPVVKRALASSLAAVGDSIFWGVLRPACSAVTLLLWVLLWKIGAPHAVCGGAAVSLILFNLFALTLRWEGIGLGYRWGEDLPAHLKTYRWREKMRVFRACGLVAALGLCAANIIRVYRGSARDAMEGILLLAGCVALRHLGMSSMKLYAVAGVGAALFITAGGL